MDNRFTKLLLIIFAFVLLGLWFIDNRSDKPKTKSFEIDYDLVKKKTSNTKPKEEKVKPLSDEFIIKKEPIPKPQEILSGSNELKENLPEPPRLLFCRANLNSCMSCLNPYNSTTMNCDLYIKEFEQKQVFDKLKNNPNFNEYMRTYHPNIPVDSFSLQDLKSMINHYASLIQQTPEDTFRALGIESTDIIYCNTVEANCL